MAIAKLIATPWEIPHLMSISEFNTFAAKLGEWGFSGVVLNYLPHVVSFGTPNRQGNVAATGGYASNFVMGTGFANDMEAMLTICQQNNLEGIITPAWEQGYMGTGTGQLRASNAYQWGFDLDQRFGDHPAMRGWNYGGDNFGGNFDENVWIQMRAGMDQSAANRGGTVATVYYHYLTTSANAAYAGTNPGWMDVAAPETGHCDTSSQAQAKLATVVGATAKPVHAGEMRYEQIAPSWCGDTSPRTPQNMRDDANAAAAAGCVGYWYAHNEWWQVGGGSNGGSGQGWTGVLATLNENGGAGPQGLQWVIADHGPFTIPDYSGGGGPGPGTLTEVRVNLGALATGLWAAGSGFVTGGVAADRPTHTIDLSHAGLATMPAELSAEPLPPAAIGQSEMWDGTSPSDMVVRVQVLPTDTYNVELFFCETWFGPTGQSAAGGAGSRMFNWQLWGSQLWASRANWDTFVEANGENRLVKFAIANVTPDVDGWFEVRFTRNLDNPHISGMRVLSMTPVVSGENTVTWFSADPSHDRWEVYHRAGDFGPFTLMATLVNRTYTFSGLDPNVNNYWKVRGGDSNGWALFSNEKLITPEVDVTIASETITPLTVIEDSLWEIFEAPDVTVSPESIRPLTVLATSSPTWASAPAPVGFPRGATIMAQITPLIDAVPQIGIQQVAHARFTKIGHSQARFQ